MKSFTVENILTWGLEQDKEYGGYKLPVSFKKEPTIEKAIQKLVDKYNTNQVFYGDSKTIYFRVWDISTKQDHELLDRGRQHIDIQFEMEEKPVESKNGNMYIKFKVTGLKKNHEGNSELVPKDEF